MHETYLAAVPAIGFVQVWLSPAQKPFAVTSGVASFQPAPAHDLSEKKQTRRPVVLALS